MVQPTSSSGTSEPSTTSPHNTSLAGRNAKPIQDTASSTNTPSDPCIQTSGKAKRFNARPRNPRFGLADSMSETPSPQLDSSDPAQEWFKIREILAERRSARNARKKEYCVDWCPSKETGEEFSPTWEPEENINLAALVDWQRKQYQKKKGSETSAQKNQAHSRKAIRSDRAASEPADDSSQPVLPANQRKRPRRRLLSTPESEFVEEERTKKRPRFDSENPFSSPVERRLVVEVCIPQKLSYDTSEYLSVSNSQNTNSQPISAQEEEDDLILFPIDSQRTIPDSQEWESPVQQSVEVPDSQKVSSLETNSFIPSRQPDPGSFSRVPSLTPDDSVNYDPAQDSEIQALPTTDSEETPSRPIFVTQDLDSNYYPIFAGASSGSAPGSEPSVEVSQTISSSSQAAQVVPPAFAFQPHSQLDQIPSSSSSSAVVPDTELRINSKRVLIDDRFSSQPSPSVDTPSRMSSSGTPKRSATEILLEAALSGFKPLVPDPEETLEPQQDTSAETSGAQFREPELAPAQGAEQPSLLDLHTTTTSLVTETLQPSIQINSEPQPEVILDITSIDATAVSNPELQHPHPLIAVPDSLSGPFLGPDTTESLPRTVSPSEISRSVEPELPQMQMDEPLSLGFSDSALEAAVPAQGTASPSIDGGESCAVESNEHLVTLQMPANVMQLYVDTYNSYKHEIETFSEVNREGQDPDPAIIAKIDLLLEQLYRLCDYPGETSSETIRQLSSQDLAKHAQSSNVKLFFVGQLIEKLATSNKKVLAVARSPELVGYMEAIITSIGDIAYSKTNLEDIKDRGSEPELAVVLAHIGQLVKDPGNFDVVVAFDSGFASSEIAKNIEAIPAHAKPITLTLVNTYSIEHLDLAVPTNMDSLTRKNAMLISLYHSRPYLSHFEDDISADRIAAHFAGHIMDQEPDTYFEWKPQEVPHILLDFYGSSQRMEPTDQSQAQADGDGSDSRKRKLDDTEDLSAKRPRHSMPQEELDETVRSQVDPDPSQIHVTVTKAHLDALQATADQLGEKLKESDELEVIRGKQIKQMSKQIKSYESTANTIQQRLMEAQHERASSEKTRKIAEDNAKATDTLLQSEKDKYILLEEKYNKAVVERSSEDATFAELTAKGKELENAQAKIQELERRLKNKDGELDYARSVFQTERQAAHETMQENRDLREELQKLKAERAQDLIKVQTINAANGQAEMQRLVLEAQAIARDREAELDRVKEELKTLKNGRRETRGASVPRSPRMGVMSPRNGRGGISTVASTAASTGVSRGTSPAHLAPFDQTGMPPAVPGNQFFNPPASNGRFNHLRDFM